MTRSSGIARRTPLRSRTPLAGSYALGWFVRTGHVPAHTPVHLAGRGWSLLGPAGEITATERSAAA